MTRYRFNPPPTWPKPPSRDWRPPIGWRPPTEWGPAPQGWQLWIQVTKPLWTRPVMIVAYVVAGLVFFFSSVGYAVGGGDDTPATAASASSSETSKPSTTPAHTPTTTPTRAKATTTEPVAEPTRTPSADRVVFRVWGHADNGASITYGSDSDNRQGQGMPFRTSLEMHDDALYYSVFAQLQGGGDIHCSVTVNGHTKKAHASGGYTICHAQLSQGAFGWS